MIENPGQREAAAKAAEEARQLELARRAGEEQLERVRALRAAEAGRQRESAAIEQAQQELAEARRRESEAEEDALQAEAERRRLEVEASDDAERAALAAGNPMSTLVIAFPRVPRALPATPPASAPAGRRPDGTPMSVPVDRAIAIVPGLGVRMEGGDADLYPDRRQRRGPLGLVLAGPVLLLLLVVAWRVGGDHQFDGIEGDASASLVPASAPSRPSSVTASAPEPVPGRPALVPVNAPLPVFPPVALDSGVSGKVVARFTVDIDGSVSAVRVIESTPPGLFDGTVQSTVRLWRFEPIDSAQEATRTFTFTQ